MNLPRAIPETQRRTAGSEWTLFLLSLLICGAIATPFVLTSEDLGHWAIVPIVLSGGLIGIDALKWLTRKVDIFDPVGILGLFGIHFFFLAPILHIYWETEMPYVPQPPHWPDWLGWMALLNSVSLVFYRFGLARAEHSARAQKAFRVVWKPAGTLLPALLIALTVSFAAQVWVYVSFSGFTGLIDTVASASDTETFTGFGRLFFVADSFSILLLICLAVICKRNRIKLSWPTVVLLLIAFLLLRLMFGGLRGSRSHTIWGLFWATGIVHFWIRSISRKEVLGGLLFLLLFMYVYGFYKEGGLDGLEMARYEDTRTQLESRAARSLTSVILGDLGRSDVQAYLLYRLYGTHREYEYAHGRTYLGALALIVPRTVWPDRPATKIKEGTDIQFGSGSFNPGPVGAFFSLRVYGLAGETLLNFGPAAVPFAFALLGLFTGKLRRLIRRLDPSDVRWLLVPLLVTFPFAILSSDSDNLLLILARDLAIPALVLFIGSARVYSRPGAGFSPDERNRHLRASV